MKTHFIHDSAMQPRDRSRKARRNLAIAERTLELQENPPAGAVAAVAAQLHVELQTRRSVSRLTRMPPEHFARLLALPECVTLAASDGEGIAGLLIGVQRGAETHLLHLLSARRGVPKCAGYLLMATALETWGRHGRVYLGGAPTGPDAAGIERFKARWANREAPAFLLTAVLRDDLYADLVSLRRSPPDGYFPAYRDAGIRPAGAVADA